ncbi:hypothetical protein SAMN02799630_03383 [Paenibacillus sp. UNCCL117]|uniref:DUF6886 family protein n=1 Tax=unclassified Paenibacillus TaxID=185978 RepID=UPI0008890943|nr:MULTISPECIES: DUF6886 family protein [unclassified Paenibacillus]SDE44402.1 hypothetical protein SAMN04488602_12855 [Paenibacillus sp. cl123]SFW46257.1 hypothetical protein SAMN02799630_03383 [Paenibacillus sp. UNCCL117]
MLYHFSENPNIDIFEPRKLESRPDEPSMVWAIDEFHSPHYWFPRDCPRVCIWPDEDTKESDIERFFGLSRTKHIVAIESGWLDRVRAGSIYRYSFKPEEFALYDRHAGYYTATHTVQPEGVERIDDLLGSLTAHGIEVRLTPSLLPLQQAILKSTVQFSMIRMRNALLK